MKKNKSRKSKHDPTALAMAVQSVQKGMSLRKASIMYGIPRSTLSDRSTGKIKLAAIDGKLPHLSNELERSLIKEAHERADRGIGFSKTSFLRYVGVIAALKGRPFKKGMPSNKWWVLFNRRHPDMSLRLPESTASVRHQCMRRDKVQSYFKVLQNVLTEHQIVSPSSIWNMDETCIQLATRPSKVVARKGSRYLHSKSGSRENFTVIAGGNASGKYLPLCFVVKGKTKNALKGFDTENAPEKSLITATPSGWTKQGLALKWFENTFIPNIGPVRPQLLILDGHDSHHHVELLTSAIDNSIILMEMPSHCSHWLQPMDRTVFGPLKAQWKSVVNEFTASTGTAVRKANFFRIFSKAYNAVVAQPAYLVNGFRATGIYPFDPSQIPNEAYMPSELYTRQTETTANEEVATSEPVLATACFTPAQSNEDITPVKVPPSPDIQSATPEPASVTVLPNTNFQYGSLTATPCTLSVQEDPPITESVTRLSTDDTIEKVLDHDGDMNISLTEKDMSFLAEFLQDADGIVTVDDTTATPATSNSIQINHLCPPELALAAVESSLSTEVLANYKQLLISGKELPDYTFQTWKHYTEMVHPSINLLKRPTVTLPVKQLSKKSQDQYFVLTCEEAYKAKVEAKMVKEEKEKQKEERKRIRLEKTIIKQEQKNEKEAHVLMFTLI